MSDFLKSKQKYIRGCFLYEYLLCPALSIPTSDLIAFSSNFRSHFHGRIKVKTREEKIAEKFKKYTLFQLYLNFCTKLELENEEFLWREAEALIWQFDRDDFDVSKDFDSKSQITLPELPLDVLDHMLAYLDLESRNNFSLTCRAFRNLSEAFLGNSFKEVELTLALENSKYVLEFSITNGPSDFLTVDYLDVDVDYCRVKTNVEKFVTKDFVELGFDHFQNFLKTPNLRIGELRIQTLEKVNSWKRNKFFNTLEEILRVRSLEVKILNMHTNYEKMHMMSILPYLEPGKLEEIHLSADTRRQNDVEEDISRIPEMLELRQWKQAKVLKIQRVLADLTVQNIAHFESFEGQLIRVRPEDLLFLKNALLNAPKLSKSWNIEYNNMNMDLVLQLIPKENVYDKDEDELGLPQLHRKYENPVENLKLYVDISLYCFCACFKLIYPIRLFNKLGY